MKQWGDESVVIGAFPITVVSKKASIAKALLTKWRQKDPLPSKEWVVSELKERLGMPPQAKKVPKNTFAQDADCINITSKYLKKNKDSLCGVWILDRSLGNPSMKLCLEAINLPQEIIDAHIDKKEGMDVMCHINLTESHFKIRSFYIQDTETPPRVMNLPLGEEIVERHGGKRTLVTSKRRNQVEMKISMMTVSGFIEYWDTKELVPFTSIELPQDYPDRPERVMRQNVTLKNNDSGEKHSLVRYYLAVDD